MKNIRFLTFILILGTLILSACGAGTATPAAAPVLATVTSPKAAAMPVAFVGIVDRITGDQWVISGTTVTVDASIVRDGPFKVGDQVKVEGLVNPDGSFTVSRVEAPTPQDAATQTPVVGDNTNDAGGNANTNDANVNDGNTNASNSNDSNSNDDNGGGNTNDDNSNDDNSNSANSNDDNGNDGNSNDDNGGGNSNDGNGNDDNSGRGGGDDDSGDDDNSNDD